MSTRLGFRLSGAAAGDFSAISVASAGDVNGDGFTDIVARDGGGNLKLTLFPSVTIDNSIIANGTAPSNPDLLAGASNVAAVRK